jgi:hypothetical protein
MIVRYRFVQGGKTLGYELFDFVRVSQLVVKASSHLAKCVRVDSVADCGTFDAPSSVLPEPFAVGGFKSGQILAGGSPRNYSRIPTDLVG